MEDGHLITIGSFYLDSAVPVDEYELQVQEILKNKPCSQGRTFLIGDANTHMAWTAGDPLNLPNARGGKLQTLLDSTGREELHLIPQDNADLPTFTSRKQDVKTSQIDVAFASTTQCQPVHVAAGSRTAVGTDHDHITLRFQLPRMTPHPDRRVRKSGPRRVTCSIPTQTSVTQLGLQTLARASTRPYPQRRFQPSAEAKQLGKRAKISKNASAWKHYHTRLREERRTWQQQLVRDACSSWDRYREFHHEKKKSTAWAASLAQSSGDDPFLSLQAHFRNTFAHSHGQQQALQIQAILDKISGTSPALSPEEVKRAILAGKLRKSPGPDDVPLELLRDMAKDDESLRALTFFFQDLFGGKAPNEWEASFVSLLSKVECPSRPSDLRPIAVHSHVAKTFSRIILGRTYAALHPTGPEQQACRGRQSCDFVWTALRVAQLSLEWGEPIAMLKIDIAKAFDVIDRVKLATMIAEKLRRFPLEARHLISSLLPGSAVVCSPWGTFRVTTDKGVKQGGVESPVLFALAMEQVLHLVHKAVATDWLGLGFDDICFMDDDLGWAGSVPLLQRKVDALGEALAEWGLAVNPAKCQLLTRGDVKGNSITIAGHAIKALPADQGLSVMGIPVKPGLTPMDLVCILTTKARKKFWACKDLLQSEAPLRHRLALLYRTVWASMAWTIGAVVPSRQSLEFLNTFLYSLVALMVQVKRRPNEFYVDFKARSFRTARYLLQQAKFERWSTSHLRMAWRYAGHRSRGMNVDSPGAAAILTHFRTLDWWMSQQASSTGLRHKRRHYPRITLEEKMFTSIFKGQDWRPFAEDKALWKAHEQSFVEAHDCPWASHQQLALEL